MEFGEGDGVVVELGRDVDLDGGLGHCGEGEEDLFFFLEIKRYLQRDVCKGRNARRGYLCRAAAYCGVPGSVLAASADVGAEDTNHIVDSKLSHGEDHTRLT